MPKLQLAFIERRRADQMPSTCIGLPLQKTGGGLEGQRHARYLIWIKFQPYNSRFHGGSLRPAERVDDG